ncbi:hypothetical protein I551_9107 [Mycobacterium ulcerans str. Harvey]|uniref:Uncharacterized protein n=1 Tax=Mycobacterium ulcerans str. Harvey TaxID=1299332 RepID=A0ABN0R912_MYCUL|nr:hypothetical protein I551_9107 [Mycobacterium ulcerans str. Harvey]
MATGAMSRIVSELRSQKAICAQLAVGKKPLAWERPLRKSDLAPWRPPAGNHQTAIFSASGGRRRREVRPGRRRATVYFTTPHFDGYPAVLVVLSEIEAIGLEELLTEAWLTQAPKRLAKEFLTGQPSPVDVPQWSPPGTSMTRCKSTPHASTMSASTTSVRSRACDSNSWADRGQRRHGRSRRWFVVGDGQRGGQFGQRDAHRRGTCCSGSRVMARTRFKTPLTSIPSRADCRSMSAMRRGAHRRGARRDTRPRGAGLDQPTKLVVQPVEGGQQPVQSGAAGLSMNLITSTRVSCGRQRAGTRVAQYPHRIAGNSNIATPAPILRRSARRRGARHHIAGGANTRTAPRKLRSGSRTSGPGRRSRAQPGPRRQCGEHRHAHRGWAGAQDGLHAGTHNDAQRHPQPSGRRVARAARWSPTCTPRPRSVRRTAAGGRAHRG